MSLGRQQIHTGQIEGLNFDNWIIIFLIFFASIINILIFEKIFPQNSDNSRHHVDSGYTSLPLSTFRRQAREDARHYVEAEALFADWIGYIRTWSGLQNMGRQEGGGWVQVVTQACLSSSPWIL